jgi:glutathione S-transferase
MGEVLEKLDADFEVCEMLLEDSGAFLTGSTPTQADCFLYGILDHVRPMMLLHMPPGCFLSNQTTS